MISGANVITKSIKTKFNRQNFTKIIINEDKNEAIFTIFSHISILKNQIDLIGTPLLQHVLTIHDDGFGTLCPSVGSKIIHDIGMILLVIIDALQIALHEGRIMQCMAHKHLLEHPEQALDALLLAIEGTFVLSAIIVAEGE